MKNIELTLLNRDAALHPATSRQRMRTGVKAGFGDDGYGCGTPLGDRFIVRQQTND